MNNNKENSKQHLFDLSQKLEFYMFSTLRGQSLLSVKEYKRIVLKMLSVFKASQEIDIQTWGGDVEIFALKNQGEKKIKLSRIMIKRKSDGEIESFNKVLEQWKAHKAMTLDLSSKADMKLYVKTILFETEFFIWVLTEVIVLEEQQIDGLRKKLENYFQNILDSLSQILTDEFPYLNTSLEKKKRILEEKCNQMMSQNKILPEQVRKSISKNFFKIAPASILGKVYDHPSNKNAILKQIWRKKVLKTVDPSK